MVCVCVMFSFKCFWSVFAFVCQMMCVCPLNDVCLFLLPLKMMWALTLVKNFQLLKIISHLAKIGMDDFVQKQSILSKISEYLNIKQLCHVALMLLC